MAQPAVDALLAKYRAKRRFGETTEPQGAAEDAAPGAKYLIQKHAATRLHYDFRLELDGVLLSWAVTRGPSYNTKDRRLAVRTEDHPLEYGGFEGTIPPGNYGGGTVMLWDTGSWVPVGDPRAGLAKGKLVFLLYGKRLIGRWGLIRMKPRPKEKNENWLLIKEVDEYANTHEDLLETATTSVVSDRDLAAIAAGVVPARRAKALPAFMPPMLATLVDAPPAGEDWLFEVKFDGYRAQIAALGDAVKIYTRSGLDWSAKFPHIVKAVQKLDLDGALLDGEIVVLDAQGRSDFGALVQTLEAGRGPMDCFVFDLLALGGESLAAQSLTARKAALQKLLAGAKGSPIRYSDDFAATAKDAGAKLLAAACERGLEGLIAKRRDLAYRGGRHGAWLKVKCRHEQEFIILGFAASTRGREFSSLLVGVQEAGGIRYAGRIGTGFDAAALDRLGALRDENAVSSPAAAGIAKAMQKNVTWVQPVLVANIAFAGWTPDGNVRHGAFIGLREDKAPAEVVREMPVARPEQDDTVVEGVKISHGGKTVYERPPVAKIEIAHYIDQVAGLMLPYAAGRFITLVRAPGGPEKKTFYQRHPHAGFGDGWKAQHFKDADYIYFEAAPALVAAVQMNVLEFHIWGSRVDDVDRPDRIVFDLDPDPGVDFATVKQAAVRVRDVLAALGLQSLPLLSGGKGVHVVAPVTRKYEWPVIKEFANKVSHRIATDAPDKFVATMSKAKRVNKIFIDHFRNERGATAIAPYSPRARPGAAVAWPVDWAGLAAVEAANAMTIPRAMAAVAAGENGWAGYGDISQVLSVGALRALDVAF